MIRESWLTEIAPDAPCGPDLEYDQDFLALARAARGKEEQQYGDTVIPAEEPVWADVVERATALLERTRDLRVATLFARGVAHTQGIAGASLALGFVRDLLDRFWEPLHPSLLFEGEPDPVLRMNALAALADNGGFVRDLRGTVFLRTPAVTLTVQEALAIVDRGADAPGLAEMRSALADVAGADPAALAETPAMLAAVNAIRSRLLAHLDPGLLPDFAPLLAVLQPLARLVSDARSQGQGAPAASGAATTPAPAGPARALGDIQSREDALRALDRVCDFLGRHEPTNPAPLLIRRAQRIMTMPFLDIIRELAPDATGHVETITGAAAGRKAEPS